MTAGLAAAPSMARGGVGATAEGAIARRTFRQLWLGASVCGVAFGVTVASSALTYAATFTTEASRQQLAATTSSDRGLAVLLGPIGAVDTVGGYTVYKGFVFLTTIGALWGLFAATRVLRGAEDTGRWQVMLAGSTRPARATLAAVAALGAAVGIVFAGTTAITLLAARNPDLGFGTGETVLYGLSLALVPAVFVAVGAFTSQLSRTRRMATGLGIGVFGVTFVIRMIADSGPGTQWLLWLTPFGWSELMRPFTVNDPWPLLPAGLVVVALVAGATIGSSRHDVGDGVLSYHDVARVRPFGLNSAFGLVARLDLPVLVGWCAGAAATGLSFGIVAKLTSASIPASMNDTLQKLGVQGSFAKQYFGVAFLLVATVVALLPAGQVGAAADEETSGRLVNVLARSMSRRSWFVGRLALGGAGVVAAGLLAATFAWLGAGSQGVNVTLATLLGAGLNVIPTALVALGIGAVVLALAPRVAATAVYLVVGWSLLIDLLGSMVSSLHWLEHLSLFHYMALAPAQDVDPKTLAITTVVALGLCIGATLLFDRRDLRSR